MFFAYLYLFNVIMIAVRLLIHGNPTVTFLEKAGYKKLYSADQIISEGRIPINPFILFTTEDAVLITKNTIFAGTREARLEFF